MRYRRPKYRITGPGKLTEKTDARTSSASPSGWFALAPHDCTTGRPLCISGPLLDDRRLSLAPIGVENGLAVDTRLQGVKCGTRYFGLIAFKRDTANNVVMANPNSFARYQTPDTKDLLVAAYNWPMLMGDFRIGTFVNVQKKKERKLRENHFALRSKLIPHIVRFFHFLFI